jgi:hypothetical protein
MLVKGPLEVFYIDKCLGTGAAGAIRRAAAAAGTARPLPKNTRYPPSQKRDAGGDENEGGGSLPVDRHAERLKSIANLQLKTLDFQLSIYSSLRRSAS